MFALRRLIHGFFAFAVLLGGIGAEPTANPAAPAPHQDCCCGDEAACPCAPPQSPRPHRAPCCTSAQLPAALPAASKAQVRRQAQQRIEPRPWEGMSLGGAVRLELRPTGVPGALPRPPERGPERQSRLQTFRI